MRVEDLAHQGLLQLDLEGVVRFAGQRTLLLDAVAMGLLRKYLVENFGLAAARAVLTQFGFAHGWRMAEAMRAEFQWDSEEDWRRAGARTHMLQGLFHLQPDSSDPMSKGGSYIDASYEAEQHLLHFGRSETAVCWTICGLTSGYLSRTAGHEIYVLEDGCSGKGDPRCHLIGRTRDEWSGAGALDELHFFERNRLEECLEISLQRVTETLRKAERKLRERQRALVRVALEVETPLATVSRSPAMRKLVNLARRVAKVDSTVLITGESGAGKERIARLVHDESARSRGPFVAINCGAIAEQLLESELFGHSRGAFTGACGARAGLFEAADGGTLFLDEVGEVSPAMQVKLLRTLQEREVRRVGENKNRHVDVRVVAATNRDLAHGVLAGTFRQDLLYRLKVIELCVPPLRDRRDDVLALARVLLADAAARMKREMTGFAPEAADLLMRYDWPGNVRELENAMERAVALARGSHVEVDDLPQEVRNLSSQIPPSGAGRSLAQVERDCILAALEANCGNQIRTAAQLGIGTATLYRRLKSYGLIAKREPPLATVVDQLAPHLR